jgi:hypothetical protein
MDVPILFASQYLYSNTAIILGPQVPSLVEYYLVEVSQAMNSSCVKGAEDPAPNHAPNID